MAEAESQDAAPSIVARFLETQAQVMARKIMDLARRFDGGELEAQAVSDEGGTAVLTFCVACRFAGDTVRMMAASS
jgi:hypothetical protein